MSGNIKTAIPRLYKAGFARWPKDKLRPNVQIQDMLASNLADRLAGKPSDVTNHVYAYLDRSTGKRPPPPPTSDLAQLRQINALYSLLNDRYKNLPSNRMSDAFMHPKSKPTYYTDIMTELEEAPKRSFLGRLGKRLGGMFRLRA